MANPFFEFKQFCVRHDRCAMKVGTDGVLLGAWADVSDCRSVLDVGTGSGLIALMVAQRSTAQVVGIELDKEAASQAAENVASSPWSQRISIKSADFLQSTSESRFDLIVSNPPFFEQSLLSPNAQRTNARHTQTLNYETLLSKSVELLSANGRICLIVPADKEALLEALAQKVGLFITKKCYVLPTPDALPKRLLIEFSNESRSLICNQLVVEVSRHQYSPDYINLTKDFYLKM